MPSLFIKFDAATFGNLHSYEVFINPDHIAELLPIRDADKNNEVTHTLIKTACHGMHQVKGTPEDVIKYILKERQNLLYGRLVKAGRNSPPPEFDFIIHPERPANCDLPHA